MTRMFAGMTAALLAVILAFSFPVQAYSAQSAILMDCTTGRVLYEMNADQESLIASTTKIMTAIVVCEQCNVLDRMAIPRQAVGVEGSSMYLKEGEILTIQELLYGLMLHSGNDAAVALAIYCGGTLEGFVQMMNDKAHLLGLDDTHFANPHGLDSPDHHSSARDLAELACYAMKNPLFAKLVSTKTVQVGNRHLRNHNKLLWQVSGADGVKTGYTKAAGRILVSSAQRNGRRLVAVTISDPNDWKDHADLLTFGFEQFLQRQLICSGEVLGTVEIAGGTESAVELKAKSGFNYPLSDGEQPQLRLPAPGFVYAPVAEGQDAGYAYVYLNEECIGTIALEYGQTIEQEYVEQQKWWQRLTRGKNR